MKFMRCFGQDIFGLCGLLIEITLEHIDLWLMIGEWGILCLCNLRNPKPEWFALEYAHIFSKLICQSKTKTFYVGKRNVWGAGGSGLLQKLLLLCLVIAAIITKFSVG